MKGLGSFVSFNWADFAAGKTFQVVGCAPWVDFETKAKLGSKVEVVITYSSHIVFSCRTLFCVSARNRCAATTPGIFLLSLCFLPWALVVAFLVPVWVLYGFLAPFYRRKTIHNVIHR